MMPVQATDLIRILPEVVLSGAAILVMLLEPFLPPTRKVMLGWLALAGVLAAGLAAGWTASSPGLAFGGVVAADRFSLFLILLLLLVAALTLLSSIDYLEREHIRHGEFYALILLSTVGACFMVASTELIMIFLGLEIASISTYILAGFKRHDPLSNEAAVKYFLLGSFATAFLLYGIAFVYGLTGTTNLLALSEKLGDMGNGTRALGLTEIALILMFVGLAFKVSSVPFQVWTPDVYQGAPAPVTAFLSVGPKAAAFAVLVRVFLGGPAPAGSVLSWVFWISAALTMSLGNLAALWQSNVKRLLAYSSIAHAGYVLVGVTAGGMEGTASLLFYLLAYALMNISAFVLVAHLAGVGERRLDVADYAGLGYTNPAVAACLSVLLLSLAGIPATVGFLGKFYVFRAAVHSGLIGLTVIAVLNSVVSVYYYLRLIVVMYMQEGKPAVSMVAVPWPLRVVLAVSVAGIFYVGLFPSVILKLAYSGAGALPYPP